MNQKYEYIKVFIYDKLKSFYRLKEFNQMTTNHKNEPDREFMFEQP